MDPTTCGLIAIAVFALLCGMRRRRRRPDVVEEFMKKFPGRCLRCSLHRFGRENGLTSEPTPLPHHCIEERRAADEAFQLYQHNDLP